MSPSRGVHVLLNCGSGDERFGRTVISEHNRMPFAAMRSACSRTRVDPPPGLGVAPRPPARRGRALRADPPDRIVGGQRVGSVVLPRLVWEPAESGTAERQPAHRLVRARKPRVNLSCGLAYAVITPLFAGRRDGVSRHDGSVPTGRAGLTSTARCRSDSPRTRGTSRSTSTGTTRSCCTWPRR